MGITEMQSVRGSFPILVDRVGGQWGMDLMADKPRPITIPSVFALCDPDIRGLAVASSLSGRYALHCPHPIPLFLVVGWPSHTSVPFSEGLETLACFLFLFLIHAEFVKLSDASLVSSFQTPPSVIVFHSSGPMFGYPMRLAVWKNGDLDAPQAWWRLWGHGPLVFFYILIKLPPIFFLLSFINLSSPLRKENTLPI